MSLTIIIGCIALVYKLTIGIVIDIATTVKGGTVETDVPFIAISLTMVHWFVLSILVKCGVCSESRGLDCCLPALVWQSLVWLQLDFWLTFPILTLPESSLFVLI